MRKKYSSYQTSRDDDKIYGGKITHTNSITRLKNNLSFNELIDFIDSNKSLLKYYQNSLYGNPLPDSYAELGIQDKKYKLYFSETLEKEINWQLLSVRKYKKEIALFIKYKEIFENAFILGNYVLAEKYLSKIESEICYSVWTLESRLLLLEFNESSESNKSYLSEINKDAKGHFIPSLSTYISNRVEKNLSVSRYDSDLNHVVNMLKGNEHLPDREFYYYKLNKYDNKQYKFATIILLYEGCHSVIDRYLSLIDILKIKLSDSEIKLDLKNVLIKKVAYLFKKFQDPELLTLYRLSTNNFENSDFLDYDIKYKDLFISGLYEECILHLKDVMKEYPNVFEYYIIYVKSHLLSNKIFTNPINSNCPQSQILNTIYAQLGRIIEPKESIININRLIKNFQNISISRGLHKFLNDETKLEPSWAKYDLLSLPFNDDSVLPFITNEVQKSKYIDSLNKIHGHSISYIFNNIIQEDILISELNKLPIPQIIKEIELAKYYQKNLKLNDAKLTWERNITNTQNIIPLLEISIINLFNTYVELGEIDNAITLYVNNYISQNYLVYKVDVFKVHELVRKSKFKTVSKTIDLPLFYTFSKADENEMHIAYELFNRSLGVNRPSQLTKNNFVGDERKWILFLRYTSTVDIFKHSIFIDGSKDGYSERINICNLLMELDKDNEEFYKIEINELTDALIIQEGLQQLDESKIYVNESGLINYELKEFEGLYNRYKAISNIYKESNKKLLILDRRKGIRLGSIEDLSKEQYSSDPLRDSFSDIFDEITMKFLFSKFGISAYLSTRIRHGVLLGEVRPIFEKYNLISQKDSNTDKYLPIEYWDNRFSYFSDYYIQTFHKELSKFSNEIDNIILGLLKDSLQIKTEDENINGWFDYYFDDTALAFYSINCRDSKDFSDFVKKVIEILWIRTDDNLSKIRDRFKNDIKDKFNAAIEALSSELQKLPIYYSNEIFSNISTCLTEIHNVLDRIAGWFNRSGSKTSDFSLDRLITVILGNLSHSYPNRHLRLVNSSIVDITIKGYFYMHFADLFRIFLDNALKHSDQSIRDISIEISVSVIDDNILEIIISNNHASRNDLNNIFDLKNNEVNIKKLSTEGKSGFPKAEKIIRSDFENDSNSYSISQDDSDIFKVTLHLILDNLRA